MAEDSGRTGAVSPGSTLPSQLRIMDVDFILLGCAAVFLSGCGESAQPLTPPAPVLRSITTRPEQVTLLPSDSLSFEVSGTWSDGSTRIPTVTWSATGGTVTASGLYTAGSMAGTYLVIAVGAGGKADTSVVTITIPAPPPPPPGAYTPFAAEYWYAYTDESQLVGKIGVEAQAQTQLPALPVEAFYDVIAAPAVPHPDGSIGPGWVLRYLGDPALNTYPIIIEAKAAGTAGNNIRIRTSLATSGNTRYRKWAILDITNPSTEEVYDELDRKNLAAKLASSLLVAIGGPLNDHYFKLPGGTEVPGETNEHALAGGDATTRARIQFVDNVSGRTAVYGVGLGVGGKRHIWLRTFLRFSPNWHIQSDLGGAGAGSHKLMFVRYQNSAARADFTPDGGLRSWAYTVGGALAGGTVVEKGKLPWHNVKTINELYHVQGFPWPDLYNDEHNPGTFKMFRVGCQPPRNPYCGDGNGEWYEIIWHLKVGTPDAPERIELTQAMRQYTQAGVKTPLPWRIATEYKVASPGGVWRPMVKYEQGVNRNRQWDEPMWLDWAFFEIVDGDQFPNPWGLPGG